MAAIEPRPSASGRELTCIVIENDGQERWVERQTHPDPVQLDAQSILERIEEAGIVGMGGAGFPTAPKLTPPKESLLIIYCLMVVNASPISRQTTA